MRSFGYIIFLILIFSCQDIEKNERPANLIPENKMVEVLTELSILNSAKRYNKRLLEETGLKPDEYLLNKYNIDSLQLLESTSYYARNYTQFEGMYEKVRRKLETLKADLEIKKSQEQRVLDSIKKVMDSTLTDSIILIDPVSDSLRVRPLPVRYDVDLEDLEDF